MKGPGLTADIPTIQRQRPCIDREGGGVDSFILPGFRVSKRYLNIYTANPAEDLVHR